MISFVFLISTYAGMSLFGMGDQMNHGMTVDCIAHCVSFVTPVSDAPTTIGLMATVLILFLASVVVYQRPSNPPRQRWRDVIQRFLLHQKLSTVIILD